MYTVPVVALDWAKDSRRLSRKSMQANPCKNCRFNSEPEHPEAIGCAVNPVYWQSPSGVCADFLPRSRRERRAMRQQAFEVARHNLCIDLVEILAESDSLLNQLSPFAFPVIFFLLIKILLSDNPVPWVKLLLGLLVPFVLLILADYCGRRLEQWLYRQLTHQNDLHDLPIAERAAIYSELLESGTSGLLQILDNNLGYVSPRLVARIEALPHNQFQKLCWEIDRIYSEEILEEWLRARFCEQFFNRDISRNHLTLNHSNTRQCL
jgi:hypothetical protein